MKTITFKITGMTCASCAAILQKAFKDDKRIIEANVNIVTDKAQIAFDPEKISEKEIHDIVYKTGYGVADITKENKKAEKRKLNKMKKIFWWSFIFSLPLLYFAMGPMMGIPVPEMSFFINFSIQFALTTIIIVINRHIYTSGIKKIFHRTPNMDSLIVIGTLAAYLYSVVIFAQTFFIKNSEMTHIYFESAGFILVFIALGKYLEEKTKGKTGDAIKKLMGLQPKTATILKNNSEVVVPILDIKKGDTVVVKPGEKISVDGEIIFGSSTIDESSITGESIPVTKKIGDTVIGGTINKTSIVHFIAKNVGDKTMLAQIIKIMEEAVASKAPVQLLADKISYYFVPSVIGIAIIAFIIWFFLGFGIAFALTVFVSVLIIACPCSLGLATPTAVMMGTGLAAQRGILIKSSKALEIAHKINTIVFDKTGTLSKGKPEVVDIISFDFPEENLIKVAYSLAKNSNHPISEAVINFGESKKSVSVEIENFQEIEGLGITGKCKTHQTKLFLGNERLLFENKIHISSKARELAKKLSNKGKAPLFVVHGEKIIGILGIMDDVKENAKQVIAKLKKMGRKVVMITGDKKEVGEAIAKKLNIDKIFTEVLPQDKAKIIKQIQDFQNQKVAFVGDGINDAPALAQANLGIALGSGTDVALEAGEIVLVKNDLNDVVEAMQISQYTLKKIKQNLFWAFFYNSVGIPIAAGVLYPFFGFLLNPVIAAIAMSFSSVSVVSNSLLMKLYKSK
jgi:Cu+-exporting ATPase